MDGCCLVAKSCSTLQRPHGLQPTKLLCPWNFPGKNTGVGCHFLLQIFTFYAVNFSNQLLLNQESFSFLYPYYIFSYFTELIEFNKFSGTLGGGFYNLNESLFLKMVTLISLLLLYQLELPELHEILKVVKCLFPLENASSFSSLNMMLIVRLKYYMLWGFPGGTSGKEPTCQCRRHKRHKFDP